MSQSDIEKIEIGIEEARKIIERGELAEKLSKNREFKKLILEGYFVEEASRLTHLLSDPSIIRDGNQKFVENDLMGIGGLKRYLSTIVRLGHNMQDELREMENTLEELRLEEMEE